MFPEIYLKALLDSVRSADALLPNLTRASEAAAARLSAGGEIYISSDRPDFVSEGYVRSGGMMMLHRFEDSEPSGDDVIIVGSSDLDAEKDRALAEKLERTRALVISIGPQTSDLHRVADHRLVSSPLLPDAALRCLDNQLYPLVSLQNLVLLWAFTGELVAALSRDGQMPVMYQSVLVPGARERNASYETRRVHPTHDVPEIKPGLLGGSFLVKIAECVSALLDEAAALQSAAELATETLKGGQRIHGFLVSHFPVHQSGAPGDPGYVERLEIWKGEDPDLDEIDRKFESGDFFFFLGYYRRPVDAYKLVRSRNGRIIEVITGAEDQPASAGPAPDLAIDPGWHYTDSLVDVPGYDIRILPASGIVQAAVYWCFVGQITENLGNRSD